MFTSRVPPPAPIVLQTGVLRNATTTTTTTMTAPTALTSPLLKLDVILASAVFRHIVALICVFVLSFIILIAVQPPFTHTKNKDRYKRGKFSTGIAALYALGATVLAAIAMTITHFVINANAKRA
jgi:prepilin signal peptidase PulO-like enzyme (type II secretory pathway)